MYLKDPGQVLHGGHQMMGGQEGKPSAKNLSQSQQRHRNLKPYSGVDMRMTPSVDSVIQVPVNFCQSLKVR